MDCYLLNGIVSFQWSLRWIENAEKVTMFWALITIGYEIDTNLGCGYTVKYTHHAYDLADRLLTWIRWQAV